MASALILLACGFIATAVGSIWTNLSPVGGGVNFAAGLLYLGGLSAGAVGLGFGVAAFVVTRRT